MGLIIKITENTCVDGPWVCRAFKEKNMNIDIGKIYIYISFYLIM